MALEGIEGSGKSTQIVMLADRLRAAGREVVLVREPGGTPLAEEARTAVLHGHDMPPAAELFLYLAARADLVDKVIRPALAAGKIVLADRFELSSRCYQAAGRGLPLEAVQSAIALATGGLMPDIYIVLDLPVDAGRARMQAAGKKLDRLERADDAFHQRVADAFRAATGVVHVKADREAAAVHADIWKAIQPKTGLS